MSEIQIQYGDVYSQITALRSTLSTMLAEQDSDFAQALANLDGLDGASNAAYIKVVEQNREKVHANAETLTKLLFALETSARKFENKERKIATEMAAGGTSSCQMDS